MICDEVERMQLLERDDLSRPGRIRKNESLKRRVNGRARLRENGCRHKGTCVDRKERGEKGEVQQCIYLTCLQEVQQPTCPCGYPLSNRGEPRNVMSCKHSLELCTAWHPSLDSLPSMFLPKAAVGPRAPLSSAITASEKVRHALNSPQHPSCWLEGLISLRDGAEASTEF